jgi:hypothetical protein
MDREKSLGAIREETLMNTTPRALVAGISLALLSMTPALAQQPQTVRVIGTIEKVDGPTLAVKTDKGEVKVNVAEKANVFGVEKISMADVKKGDFVGVGAMPQADGSQKAIQVTVFAESLRGLGEGFRPWDRAPNSTMTNATVDTTVASTDGHMMMVKYKDGEKKIIVPPDATMLRYVVAEKSDLKPGAKIAIGSAAQKPDGTLEASRVNVGRGDVAPQ